MEEFVRWTTLSVLTSCNVSFLNRDDEVEFLEDNELRVI